MPLGWGCSTAASGGVQLEEQLCGRAHGNSATAGCLLARRAAAGRMELVASSARMRLHEPHSHSRPAPSHGPSTTLGSGFCGRGGLNAALPSLSLSIKKPVVPPLLPLLLQYNASDRNHGPTTYKFPEAWDKPPAEFVVVQSAEKKN